MITRAHLPAAAAALWDFDTEIDELAGTDLVATAIDLLLDASAAPTPRPVPLPLERLARVRDLIAAIPAQRHSTAALELLSGLDRWTLARQFRSAFGTSPSRFRTLRQLDRVREAVRCGSTLAEAALDAGFADQSHMTRQFKRSYGLTPARWAALI